jgi:tetraacyldisaccharide-1-P 4'-kinase
MLVQYWKALAPMVLSDLHPLKLIAFTGLGSPEEFEKALEPIVSRETQ